VTDATPPLDAETAVHGLLADVAEARAQLADLREQLGVIRDRLGNLAAGLDLSATASRPSKKSEIESGCAAAVRQIAESIEGFAEDEAARYGLGDGQ
jgi:hypothetical protein